MSEVRIEVDGEVISLAGPEGQPFAVELVEQEIAKSRHRQRERAAASSQVAGRYVERPKRARVVDAVLWTGHNLDVVGEWLLFVSEGAPRADRFKLSPTNPTVLLVDVDDGRVACPAGWWLVERGATGELQAVSPEQFARQYDPERADVHALRVAALEERARDAEADLFHANVEGVEWRRWARALLKEPDSAGLGDDVLRKKIQAVLEAPSAIAFGDAASELEAFADGQARRAKDDARELERSASRPLSLEHAQSLSSADPLVVEACARVGNDVYREVLNGGDGMPAWDDASPEQKEVVREATVAALSGVTPAAYHARWRAEREAWGWTYGPVKNEDEKKHPNLVAYDLLPSGQRALDALMVVAVDATRRALADYAAAVAPLVIRGKSGLSSEQFVEFKQKFLRELSSGAWVAPIHDVPVEFVRFRAQPELLEYIDEQLDSMLTNPGSWGNFRELELQVLLMLAVRAFELAGKHGPAVVVSAFSSHAARCVGDDAGAEHLWSRMSRLGRGGEFIPCMREFVREQRSAFRPIPTAVLSLFEPADDPLVALFKKHCECRPVNTARVSHSHDCDKGITNDVRTVLHHTHEAMAGEMATGVDDDHPLMRAATHDEVVVAHARLAEYLRGSE